MAEIKAKKNAVKKVKDNVTPQDEVDVIRIKKKHDIPLEKKIYNMRVDKEPQEFTGEEDEKPYWECWIEVPSLIYMEQLYLTMGDRPFSTTKEAMKQLWIEGDKEFLTDDEMIITSSLWLKYGVFKAREIDFKKK